MSDIILDEYETITMLCDNLWVKGHDLILDSAERRLPNGPVFRRAIVHGTNDTLIVNFNGDYPGGVVLNGVSEITPLKQSGELPSAVPTLVVRGELSYEIRTVSPTSGAPIRTRVSVEDEFNKLRGIIAELTARVATLEAQA